MVDKTSNVKEAGDPQSPSNENIDDNLSALGTGEEMSPEKSNVEQKSKNKEPGKKSSSQDDYEPASQAEASNEAADDIGEGVEGDGEGEGVVENTAQRRPSIANLLSASSAEGAKLGAAGSPRAPFYPYPYYPPYQGFPMPPPEGFPMPLPDGKSTKDDKSKEGGAEGDDVNEKEGQHSQYPFNPAMYGYYGQPHPYFYPPMYGQDANGVPYPFPPRQGMPFYPPGYPFDPNNPNGTSVDSGESPAEKPAKEKTPHKKKKDANVAVVSADRPYPCSVEGCRWAFARLSDQRRHLRSHQKPTFHCPYWNSDPTCHRNGGAFNRLDVLKRHLRLVHFVQFKQSESGWCRVCQKMFPTPKHFVEHCEKCALAARPTEWKIDTGRVMIQSGSGKPSAITVTDVDMSRSNPSLLSMANVDTELKDQDDAAAAAAAAAAVAAVAAANGEDPHEVQDEEDKEASVDSKLSGGDINGSRTTRSGRGPNVIRPTLSQSINAGHHVSK